MIISIWQNLGTHFGKLAKIRVLALQPMAKSRQPHSKAYIDFIDFSKAFIDFGKAFDHIDHQILLHKLDQNGVHPLIQKWHHSFLQDRQQWVKMGKPTSKWLSVNGGVPQVTLSGPELFIHMLSDLKTVATDVNSKEIERVYQSKLLGIVISDLGWEAHIHHINSKASKRIHYLKDLAYYKVTLSEFS